jgi:hypothetical protein
MLSKHHKMGRTSEENTNIRQGKYNWQKEDKPAYSPDGNGPDHGFGDID